MAITSMDGLIAAMAAGQSLKFYMPSTVGAGSSFFSMNTLVASSFGQMATATAFGSGGTTYTQGTTAGQGWPIWTAGGALTSYLSRFTFSTQLAEMLALYDLMWGCSGFNTTVLTAQSVVGFSGLPPRAPANGVGLELWCICYVVDGATASQMTVSYTNQSGVSGRTTQAIFINSMVAHKLLLVPLQAGDTGIQSVQSVTFTASTGTAGNLGLFIMNRLSTVSLTVANTNAVADFAGTGLPIINDNAVLFFNLLCSAGTTGVIIGQVDIAQG